MWTIIHIGIAKTGTTFLQNWLNASKSSLSCYGIASLSPLSAHRLAVECIHDQEVSRRKDVLGIKRAKSLADAIDEVQTCRSKCDLSRLIISSEYFSIASSADFSALLEPYVDTINTIIVYLRRQDIYAAAGYCQDVMALGQAKRFNQLGETTYTRNLDWTLLIRGWREAFIDSCVVARNYDNRRAGNALLQDFKILIGCPLGVQEDLPGRDNRSLDSERTEVVRLLNERAQLFNLQHLLQIQAEDPKPPFGLSTETTSAFESQYRQTNEALVKLFPGEFDDWTDGAWSPQGLDMAGLISKERLERILTRLL